MIEKIKKHKYQCGVGALFIVMLFLHLFRLSDLPYAINIDEVGLWYNVKSLLTNGYDQGGNSWPLLFTNYYSEQSAMYTYLATICVKLFGDNLFALRLPAVLNACLIFIFGAKCTKKMFKSEVVTVAFCVCCTIFPYFVINNRIALDCNLMLGFSTVFLYTLMKALETCKWQDFLFAGIMCGLIMYTYAISYITIPLFVAITGIYLIVNKKINFKNAVIFLLPIVVLGIPLLLIQLINIFEWNKIIVLGITLPNFEWSRHSSVGLQNIVGHLIVFGKYILMGEEISLLTSNIFLSNFYIISIPFLLIGLIQIIKEKEFSFKKIILFWLISTFCTIMLIKGGIRGYQTNALMFGCIILILDGLYWLFQKIKTANVKKILFIMLIAVYIVSFGGFCYHYFCGDYNYNVYRYENANTDFAEVVEEVKNDKKVYCLVKSVYYKIAVSKDTISDPFIYDHIYDEVEDDWVFKEHIYIDDNFVFDYWGRFFNEFEENATYVIPLKEKDYIALMQEKENFSMEIINQYAIFRRN